MRRRQRTSSDLEPSPPDTVAPGSDGTDGTVTPSSTPRGSRGVLITEGLLLLALGLWLLLDTGRAETIVFPVVGGVLAVSALVRIALGLRRAGQDRSGPLVLVQSGIVLTVGTLVAAEPFRAQLDLDTIWIVLGVGLVLTGLVGLLGALVMPSAIRPRLGAALLGTLVALLGVGMLSQPPSGQTVLTWSGGILVAGGVLLIAYAFAVVRNRPRPAPDDENSITPDEATGTPPVMADTGPERPDTSPTTNTGSTADADPATTETGPPGRG